MTPFECISSKWDRFLSLSREEEVEISKRIESAESAASKSFIPYRLHLDFQLEICQKLLDREERFDRVVLDKKIDSRESYFKSLPSKLRHLIISIKKSLMRGLVLNLQRMTHSEKEPLPDSEITRVNLLQYSKSVASNLRCSKIS